LAVILAFSEQKNKFLGVFAVVARGVGASGSSDDSCFVAWENTCIILVLPCVGSEGVLDRISGFSKPLLYTTGTSNDDVGVRTTADTNKKPLAKESPRKTEKEKTANKQARRRVILFETASGVDSSDTQRFE